MVSLQAMLCYESSGEAVAAVMHYGLEVQLGLALAYPDLPDLGALVGLEVIPDGSGDWLAYTK